MEVRGKAHRLTIIVNDNDTHHHRPVYSEIVHRAHQAGLAGAAVFRGIEGYGIGGHVHTSRVLAMSDGIPVAVVIVDRADRIRAFLPSLEDLVAHGLVTVDEVDVVTFSEHEPGSDTA